MLQKQIFVVSPVRRFLKPITEVESLMPIPKGLKYFD